MTPDAIPSWVDRLPPRWAVWARLARIDRPVGVWLLFWPCLAGAFLATPAGWWPQWPLFLVGALAMRSAGCVWNDLVDRDLDRRVARTAARPIASGAISPRAALAFLVVLSLLGLGVLAALPRPAQAVALASLLLVAAYPFMKRITWWPQAWLGLTFNWGVPVGWAAADPALRADLPAMLLIYAGAIAWTLGYDTVYATQDIEDDALAGIRSSARRLQGSLGPAVGLFYLLAALLLAAGLWQWTASPASALAALPFALHLAWQVRCYARDPRGVALPVFRANASAGALLALAVLATALLGPAAGP